VNDVSEEDEQRLLRLAADTLLGLNYNPWHFGDSVAFEAMIVASDALVDVQYSAFAHGFARSWIASHGDFHALDCTAPGLAMCRLYEITGDPKLKTALVQLGEYLRARRTVEGIFVTWERAPLVMPYGPVPPSAEDSALLEDPGAGVFLDCLHFDPPFFASLCRITGLADWADAAVAQAKAYIRVLQDRDSGLFHHFLLEKTLRRYAPGWGRGQGWALLGLLDVLESCPESSGLDEIRQAAEMLCNTMVRWQREDGHWWALVDDPLSGPETSTAAFMAVGLRRAQELGVGAGTALETAAERAAAATIRATDESGILTGVSAEVWASTSTDHYRHVPRNFLVPWGQGPLTLALASQLRSERQ
jgi:unsaturated rhamnogalacturonyl hydrolase